MLSMGALPTTGRADEVGRRYRGPRHANRGIRRAGGDGGRLAATSGLLGRLLRTAQRGTTSSLNCCKIQKLLVAADAPEVDRASPTWHGVESNKVGMHQEASGSWSPSDPSAIARARRAGNVLWY